MYIYFFGHICTAFLLDFNQTQNDFKAVKESCLVISYVYNQYAGTPKRDDQGMTFTNCVHMRGKALGVA